MTTRIETKGKIYGRFFYMLVLLFMLMASAQAQNERLRLSTAVSPAVPSPLDFYIGERGSIQIYRHGNAQLYDPLAIPNSRFLYNGIFLLDGDYLIATRSIEFFYDRQWNGNGEVTNVSGSGTEADPWQITAKLVARTSVTYNVDVTYSYVNGKDYVDVSLQVTIPAGNTDVIRVCHLMDTYLTGSDNGAAYTVGTDPYSVVGVTRDTIYEAFVVGNLQWDGYGSHYYEDLLNEPYFDGELSNTLDTDPNTDNAIGVQWTLGVVSGVQPPITYRLGFSDEKITPVCTNVITNGQIRYTVKK